MSTSRLSTSLELEELDRFYREGGLRHMASPHVHYHEPTCPHAGCGHKMEWIDFQLELCGDTEGIYKPLVRSWWREEVSRRCPGCGQWIRFTTLRMEELSDEAAKQLPQLPERSHYKRES